MRVPARKGVLEKCFVADRMGSKTWLSCSGQLCMRTRKETRGTENIYLPCEMGESKARRRGMRFHLPLLTVLRRKSIAHLHHQPSKRKHSKHKTTILLYKDHQEESLLPFMCDLCDSLFSCCADHLLLSTSNHSMLRLSMRVVLLNLSRRLLLQILNMLIVIVNLFLVGSDVGFSRAG